MALIDLRLEERSDEGECQHGDDAQDDQVLPSPQNTEIVAKLGARVRGRGLELTHSRHRTGTGGRAERHRASTGTFAPGGGHGRRGSRRLTASRNSAGAPRAPSSFSIRRRAPVRLTKLWAVRPIVQRSMRSEW